MRRTTANSPAIAQIGLFEPSEQDKYTLWKEDNCTPENGLLRCNVLFLSTDEEVYQIFKAQTK